MSTPMPQTESGPFRASMRFLDVAYLYIGLKSTSSARASVRARKHEWQTSWYGHTDGARLSQAKMSELVRTNDSVRKKMGLPPVSADPRLTARDTAAASKKAGKAAGSAPSTQNRAGRRADKRKHVMPDNQTGQTAAPPKPQVPDLERDASGSSRARNVETAETGDGPKRSSQESLEPACPAGIPAMLNGTLACTPLPYPEQGSNSSDSQKAFLPNPLTCYGIPRPDLATLSTMTNVTSFFPVEAQGSYLSMEIGLSVFENSGRLVISQCALQRLRTHYCNISALLQGAQTPEFLDVDYLAPNDEEKTIVFLGAEELQQLRPKLLDQRVVDYLWCELANIPDLISSIREFVSLEQWLRTTPLPTTRIHTGSLSQPGSHRRLSGSVARIKSPMHGRRGRP